jgi:hypothetical protein|tara:strand:+ start:1101 stop:1676 length:576 start_codon:yes stop_codon:yes gene_type:complete
MLSDLPIDRIDAESTRHKQIDQFLLQDIPNKNIADIIISEGDMQHDKTNLKCAMTDWYIHLKFNEIEKLTTRITDLINKQEPPGVAIDWIMDQSWGAVYNKGEGSISHSHVPYGKSFVYYVQAEEGSSPLVFDRTYVKNRQVIIKPKTGLLVVFPSDLEHSVPDSTMQQQRVILSGNLFLLPKNIELQYKC